MKTLNAAQIENLINTLQTVNRNILDEANRIGEGSRSYDSLLGEAAGVRMALGFLQQEVEA